MATLWTPFVFLMFFIMINLTPKFTLVIYSYYFLVILLHIDTYLHTYIGYMTKQKGMFFLSFAEVELLTLLGLIKPFTVTFKLSNCIKEVTTNNKVPIYYCFSDH